MATPVQEVKTALDDFVDACGRTCFSAHLGHYSWDQLGTQAAKAASGPSLVSMVPWLESHLRRVPEADTNYIPLEPYHAWLAAILFRCCFDSVSILFRFWTDSVSILDRFCFDSGSVLFQVGLDFPFCFDYVSI